MYWKEFGRFFTQNVKQNFKNPMQKTLRTKRSKLRTSFTFSSVFIKLYSILILSFIKLVKFIV